MNIVKKSQSIFARPFFQMVYNSARLLGGAMKQRPFLVVALLGLMVVLSVAPFVQSGARALLINVLVAAGAEKMVTVEVWGIVLLLIGSLVLPAMAYRLLDYFEKMYRFFIEERFELLLLRHYATLDVPTHEDPKHNDLFNKINENGVWRIINSSFRPFFLFQSAGEVLLASAVLVWSQWWVFLLVLIMTLPELIIESRSGGEVWDIHSSNAERRRRFWDLRSHFTRFANLLELKLFQNTGHFAQLVENIFRDFQDKQKVIERRRMWQQLGALVSSQLAIAFAIGWFVFEVIRGEMQIGTLVFVLAAIAELRISLSTLFYRLGVQYEDNLFVTDAFKLLEMQPKIVSPKDAVVIDSDKPVRIVFDNVSFTYDGNDKSSLKNVSLTIEPGEKVALIGINGSGKTTLVKLLCRFYDPTEGRILINDIDLKEINLESWYRSIGVLFQEYAHYYQPVREAIALGDSSHGISANAVKKSAVDSEANMFIESWPKQYDQMLGKQFAGGVEPSIGQWQKLALARAFYRQPRLYILDEPTASIDAEAEAAIFERLEKLPDDVSTILISHRFSTVRHASKIVVLANGELQEIGTHSELLKKGGIYTRLFKLQAKGYQ
jgi:ATP-binding cassette subfamily B protein